MSIMLLVTWSHAIFNNAIDVGMPQILALLEMMWFPIYPGNSIYTHIYIYILIHTLSNLYLMLALATLPRHLATQPALAARDPPAVSARLHSLCLPAVACCWVLGCGVVWCEVQCSEVR